MRVDAVRVELENFRMSAKIFAGLLEPHFQGADVVVTAQIADEKDFAPLFSRSNEGPPEIATFRSRKYLGTARFEIDESYHDEEFESLQIELQLLADEWRALKTLLDDGISQRDTTSTLGVRILVPNDFEKMNLTKCVETLKVYSIWVHTDARYSEDAPFENYALRHELRGTLR